MSPGPIRFYSADMSLANAKDLSQFSLSKLGFSNGLNILTGKLRIIMILASFVVRSMATLVHHVSDVLSMGSHGKMLWVYARRVVARMHDFHSFGNPLFVLQYPGNSIGHIHFSSIIVNAKLTLASRVFRRHPRPTLVGGGFLNFTPKPNFKFFIKHGLYVHFEQKNFKYFEGMRVSPHAFSR
jgi:hypothetical protein